MSSVFLRWKCSKCGFVNLVRITGSREDQFPCASCQTKFPPDVHEPAENSENDPEPRFPESPPDDPRQKSPGS